MSLEPGARLGPYGIASLIGAGGMGEVYRAHDTRLDRDVAIKVLPAGFAADPDRLRRFEQEARAASALNHPNILTVYDVGAHDSTPFLVTELLEGSTLKERLRGRPLPSAEVVEVGLQLADALAAAHARGIVHRDIKPANIFVTTRGGVKLLDFGLAKMADAPSSSCSPDAPTAAREPVTETGVTLGTVGYMSPEQVRGESVDARTDLFSLGVVLYEMATGSAPFQGATAGAVLSGILTRAPAPPGRLNPDVPGELDRIVVKALEKDRDLRYLSAGDLRVDLARFKRMPVSGRAAAPGAAAPPRVPSLAVLPFVNLSTDRENEYFCDGLSDELSSAMSHIRELRVAARTSAFAYKGKNLDVREIGAQLGVGAVLEGSVRKSGQRLRITAQLVNVADGYDVWSGRFDRELKDIFDIQEEIALAIVDQLKLRVLKPERERVLKRPTEDPEAYDLYLKGRYHWYRRYEKGVQLGLQRFQQAIERDPRFALAHVGVADTFGILGIFSFMSPHQAYSRAFAAASRALELDPDLAEASASLGFIATFYDWNWQAAERHFLAALRRKPDYALAHHWYGNLLTCTGRFDEAIREMQTARDLEPLEPINPTHLGLALHHARRFDESAHELNKVIASDPELWIAYWYQSANLLARGMWSDAVAMLRKVAGHLSTESVVISSTLGHAYGAAGMADEAAAVLRRMDAMSKDRYVGAFWRAPVWIGLGETDKALDCLEQAYPERESLMAYLEVWPLFDRLRPEPRFQSLLGRMNLGGGSQGSGLFKHATPAQ